MKVPTALSTPFVVVNRWTSNVPATAPVPSAKVPVVVVVLGSAGLGFAVAVLASPTLSSSAVASPTSIAKNFREHLHDQPSPPVIAAMACSVPVSPP